MVTLQNELRSIVSKRAPAYFDVQQMIARDNGEEFGSPLKWILWNSATVPTNQIKNTNSAADTPARWSKDDTDALIWEERKSGVNAGKLLTGQAGGVFYPTLQSKASAAGTVNFSASSAGVVTRPELANTNGSFNTLLSNATQTTVRPMFVVTSNGTIEEANISSTEALFRPQARVWNGTIDYLKSNATELLIRTQARLWNGTDDFLKANATELLVNPKLRVWDLTNAFLTANVTETLINPILRVWDLTTNLLTANATLQKVAIGAAPVSTNPMATIAGGTVITDSVGILTSTATGLEFAYTVATSLATIAAITRPSTLLALSIFGDPIKLVGGTGFANRIEAGTTGIGFFNVGQVAQQTGGAAMADTTWSAGEVTMLQKVYDAMRAYGLLT